MKKGYVLNSDQFLNNELKLPVIVGKDGYDNLIIENLCNLNNLLVVGQMGTPKVSFIHSLVCGLFLKCSPEEMKMLLLDFGGVELGLYDKILHTKFMLQNLEVDGPITRDYDKCIYALDRLAKESVFRYQKIKESGTQNIEEYNKQAEEKMPYIVCVVEYSHLLKKKDIQMVESFINQISSFSKEVGICLIYTLNRMMSYDDKNQKYEVLTKNMVDSFSSKIVFIIEDTNNLLKDYPTINFEHREHWFVKQNLTPQKMEMPFFNENEFSSLIVKTF